MDVQQHIFGKSSERRELRGGQARDKEGKGNWGKCPGGSVARSIFVSSSHP